jgi:hypothetical protein
MISCQYATRARDRGPINCALGWYGGKPYLGNCLQCQRSGHNTAEAKAAFDAQGAKTHPANKARISGCCDRADQW